MKKKVKKTYKVKGFMVSSCWGAHAFYCDEVLARKHWKDNKRAEIFYRVTPTTITYTI